MSMFRIGSLSVPLVTAVVLASCTPQAPACSGSDVEAVVFDVVRDQLGLARYQHIRHGADVAEDVLYLGQQGVTDFTLDHVIANPRDETARADAMAAMQFASASMLELSGIRTNETNEASRATACAATLSVNDDTLEITYNAQYSEDGMVYVEVFGL